MRPATAISAHHGCDDWSGDSGRTRTPPDRPNSGDGARPSLVGARAGGARPGQHLAGVTPGTSRAASIEREQGGGSHTGSSSLPSEDETEEKAAAATVVRRKRGKVAQETIEAPDPVAKRTRSKKEESEREEPALQAPSS